MKEKITLDKAITEIQIDSEQKAKNTRDYEAMLLDYISREFTGGNE